MALFDRCQPDVVVTDIIMPEQEGLQTLMEIHKRQPAMRVVTMSGGARVDNVDYLEAALRLWVTQILRKRFGPRDLLGAIDRCLAPESDQDWQQPHPAGE